MLASWTGSLERQSVCVEIYSKVNLVGNSGHFSMHVWQQWTRAPTDKESSSLTARQNQQVQEAGSGPLEWLIGNALDFRALCFCTGLKWRSNRIWFRCGLFFVCKKFPPCLAILCSATKALYLKSLLNVRWKLVKPNLKNSLRVMNQPRGTVMSEGV